MLSRHEPQPGGSEGSMGSMGMILQISRHERQASGERRDRGSAARLNAVPAPRAGDWNAGNSIRRVKQTGGACGSAHWRRKRRT
jgi:hypothetical protein